MAHYRSELNEKDWGYLLISVVGYLGIFAGFTFLAPHISKNVLSMLGQ